MMPELHPWLDSAEAVDAARKAVQIPLALLPGLAAIAGRDELYSEALAILTECALPPRDQLRETCARQGCGEELASVRKGAKFCSQKCRRQHGMDVIRSKEGTTRPHGASAVVLDATPQGHIGSMWEWPDDQRAKYAVRIIGYALNNWLRTGFKGREIPSTETLANMNVTSPEADQDAREWLTDWLEARGIRVTGDESFEELAEAASLLLGGHMDEMTCAILMAA
jgi:hypothetical protein